ncbi:hypothetical protein ACJX0J_007485, partial [Zea mays]
MTFLVVNLIIILHTYTVLLGAQLVEVPRDLQVFLLYIKKLGFIILYPMNSFSNVFFAYYDYLMIYCIEFSFMWLLQSSCHMLEVKAMSYARICAQLQMMQYRLEFLHLLQNILTEKNVKNEFIFRYHFDNIDIIKYLFGFSNALYFVHYFLNHDEMRPIVQSFISKIK